ncbi:MAG: hypothetical protein V1840_03560 [Candidatus Omnitrophota bacterium]
MLRYSERSVGVFWNNAPLTCGTGCNVSINTLGLWTDSDDAVWHLSRKTSDCLELEIVQGKLPLAQVWTFKVINSFTIEWRIDFRIEEWLHLDECHFSCFTPPRYKHWIVDHVHGDFPRIDHRDLDVYCVQKAALFVGARFVRGDNFFPAFVLEEGGRRSFPLIQNVAVPCNAHKLGFRRIFEAESAEFDPGLYPMVTLRILFFSNESALDERMEELRREEIRSFVH